MTTHLAAGAAYHYGDPRRPLYDQYVCVVDDDAAFSRSLCRSIVRTGLCHVITATNPADAAACFDVRPIGAMIIDLNLGTISGVTLLNELASYDDSAATPKLLLSASGEELQLADLQCYGVARILDKKDYQLGEVLNFIDMALGAGELERKVQQHGR